VKRDLLILYSGGADSALMLHVAVELGHKPYCVLIDYDQEHKIELQFAKRYLNEKSIPSQIVKLHGLGLRSGLTTGEKSLYKGVHEMYVPQRNLMFVSIAASIAENLGIKKIWYGANKTDSLEFPDCTEDWVYHVDELLWQQSDITLAAPLIGMTKKEVLNELERRGIDMSKVFSGYMEDNMKVDLTFLGDKKLPELKASDIIGTSFAEGDK